VISRLGDETARIVGLPDIQQRLTEQGLEPVTTSGEQFAAVIRSDIVKLSKVIKQAGIRID
jgi:tripartite-type tricarboxylate transporter receptor subunit TctC